MLNSQGGLVVALAILGVVLIVGAAGLLVQDRSRVLAPGEGAERVRSHRIRGDVASVLCVAGGMLVAATAEESFAYGHGQIVALLPTFVGACLLAVFSAVEGTWPRPGGPVRTASIRVRRLAGLSSGRLLAFVGIWTVGLLGAGGTSAAMASGPRQISRVLDDGRSFAVTPFPGWWFGLPVLVGTGVLLAWASMVIRVILTRPAVANLSDEHDLELRRQSTRRVLGGLQLVMSLSLAGLVAAAGQSLRTLGLGEGGDGSVALVVPISSGHVLAGGLLLAVALVIAVGGAIGCVLPQTSRSHRAIMPATGEGEVQ